MLERAPRHAPAWLTSGDTTDDVLGLLKTGKEAEVLLVERASLDGSHAVLLAHKRYRPMEVRKGTLEAGGFSKARTFTTDWRYQDGRKIRSSRDARAVAGKTKHGRRVQAAGWAGPGGRRAAPRRGGGRLRPLPRRADRGRRPHGAPR